MSDILIKGMKMPDACCDCDLLPEEIEWDGLWECPITEKIVHKYVEERKGKPLDCPLVEVITPHGRLIDAYKYFNKVLDEANGINDKELADNFIELSHWLLEKAPTVIEAEGEDVSD